MFLRMQLFVDGIFLQGNATGSLKVDYHKPRTIAVTIDRPELHGFDRDGGAEAFARANCSVSPNDRVLEGFKSLAERRIPAGIPESSVENWKRFQGPDGLLDQDRTVPESGLPSPMASFVREIRNDLFEALRNACFLLRWRHDLDGAHNPFRQPGAGAEWSLDGNTWYPLPANTDLILHSPNYVYPTKGVEAELQRLIDANYEEPIAHQLLREAVENRFRNRRSALVVGVAALEVGVKAFISDLLPQSRWLATNVPSPPIKQILEEYLPTLPTRLQIGGRVLPPPRKVLDQLREAVFTRNRVAHATGEDIDYQRVDRLLLAIRDVLWLLDYYAGADWALDHISTETRQALGI